MKTLHLMRHGKSSWDHPGINDIDRPLLPKGIINTTHIAEKIAELYGKPEKIICSPANRAIHTALLFARTLNIDPGKVSIVKNLYETTPEKVLEEVELTDSHINSLLIVGHNPTFTDLANHYLDPKIDNMPTSSVVSLQFEAKGWNVIDRHPVSTHFETPKKDYFS